MLKNVDLSREVAKAEYKRLKSDLDLKLADLQRQVKAQSIPVIIVFEGLSASGKGTDKTFPPPLARLRYRR
jgi:AMP-polyphosphate phosphotransferase